MGDGRICWGREISDKELARLGLTRQASLHPALLTNERISYLNRREQNYHSFRQKADLAKSTEREAKKESDKLGLPHAEGSSNRPKGGVVPRKAKLRP